MLSSWHDPFVVSTLALAGATVILAILAGLNLAYSPWSKHWNRPILTVDFDPKSKADCLWSRGPNLNGLERNLFYLKFRVINVGRTAAVDIRALLERVEQLDPEGLVDSYVPLPLKWAETFGITFLPRINRGDFAWCNLGFVSDPEPLELDDLVLTLDTIIQLPTENSNIPSGRYRMTMNIAAANAKPCRAIFEVRVPDIWSDAPNDMYGPEGLSLEIIQRDPEYKLPSVELKELKRRLG